MGIVWLRALCSVWELVIWLGDLKPVKPDYPDIYTYIYIYAHNYITYYNLNPQYSQLQLHTEVLRV